MRGGLIAEEHLILARQAQAAHGGTIGEQLVLSGYVDDEELTAFYRNRLLVPRVDPNQLARIPDRLIRLIPVDMAAEFRIIPVSMDVDQNLTIAMSDPSHTHAVDEIGFFTGTYVVRAVATQHQIAWCLAHYYGYLTALGETLLESEPKQKTGAAPKKTEEDASASLERRAAKLGREMSGGPSEFGEEQTGPTAPISQPPTRKRASTPPELAPRAGEVVVRNDSRARVDTGPAVLIDQSLLHGEPPRDADSTPDTPAVPHQFDGEIDPDATPEEPVIAHRRIAEEDTDATPPDDAENVVVLRAPKRRRPHDTDLGLGALSSEPPGARPRVASKPPVDLRQSDEATTDLRAEDPTVDLPVKQAPAEVADTTGMRRTGDMQKTLRIKRESDGTPGAPPQNGAPASASGAAVVHSDSAAAPPSPADLEKSSTRLVETLRKLDSAGSRDAVLNTLLDHLTPVCKRAVFFAIRGKSMTRFATRGVTPPAGDPNFDLEAPSTFRDIVRARLPFNGPVEDDATRTFVKESLGELSGDILAVPVTVRERVVGVLYGDTIESPIFSDHLAAASRAAGLALERILKSKKSS